MEEKSKETYDCQVQYNWKNISDPACFRNEIIPWHKCSKNESVVHYCKKSNSSLSDDTNSCSLSQNIEKETPISMHKNPDLEANGHITPSDSGSLKKLSQKSRSEIDKKKKPHYFTNRSFIRFLKKRNKNFHIEAKKEMEMKEKNTDTDNKTIDTKVSLLAESVVYETSTESYITEGLVDTNREKGISNEGKGGETRVISAKSKATSPLVNSLPKDGDDNSDKDIQLKEENKDVTEGELSDTLSDQSSTFDCIKDELNNQNVDLTFYESPSKFVENMSECVMRRFIGEECEDIWFKLYEGKKIPKKYLGIDKDLSELYILKKMAKHETTTCLIAHLTPRQKRLLAKGIFQTLDEFNIKGSRWGGLSREILKNVCKLFKIQHGLA